MSFLTTPQKPTPAHTGSTYASSMPERLAPVKSLIHSLLILMKHLSAVLAALARADLPIQTGRAV